ncbi:holo-ACP synthase [Bacillus alveayuensis]|jgi:holo-[acyl-carrier protein] synthase|uniref:holo-ACP synthase n=1 Tax=Aeribacillus alveayuensis TaxID=279215 RepID=UPI0005D1044D|nr:holo-ACP synthase [Bacillus alveayuensis]
MIVGIGIDIVEIKRIKEIVKRQPKFIERILSEREKERFLQLSETRKIEFLAGRFAAKEAYAKAIGTGIGKELSFTDIDIHYDEKGKPFILSGNPQQHVHLSLSHSDEYAVAQVIIERLSS